MEKAVATIIFKRRTLYESGTEKEKRGEGGLGGDALETKGAR